jgi:hypothetical protein
MANGNNGEVGFLIFWSPFFILFFVKAIEIILFMLILFLPFILWFGFFLLLPVYLCDLVINKWCSVYRPNATPRQKENWALALCLILWGGAGLLSLCFPDLYIQYIETCNNTIKQFQHYCVDFLIEHGTK